MADMLPKDSEQDNLWMRAHQGEGKAIATLINQSFQASSIRAEVQINHQGLVGNPAPGKHSSPNFLQ
ncbi:MAG: hypothetical protein VKJ64_19855 [Leptolyngbyaceae bacterium]|nr:hypothetical protein [Leptolyngbyaceae bacterium]